MMKRTLQFILLVLQELILLFQNSQINKIIFGVKNPNHINELEQDLISYKKISLAEQKKIFELKNNINKYRLIPDQFIRSTKNKIISNIFIIFFIIIFKYIININ